MATFLSFEPANQVIKGFGREQSSYQELWKGMIKWSRTIQDSWSQLQTLLQAICKWPLLGD